jgi:PAS domain S-box-containing protein
MSVESFRPEPQRSALPKEVGEILFDTLPDALIVRSAQGEVTRRNVAASRLGDDLNPSIDDACRHAGASVIASSVDGRWLEFVATPVDNEFLVRVRDITALRAMEEAIRHRDERARMIMRSTNDILWWADPKNGFVERQEAWEEFTGQSFDEYRNWGHVQAIHPEDRDRVQAAWMLATEERRVCICEYRVYCPAKKEYRHCMAKGVPMLDEERNVREWIGTLTDIHDLKSTQAALAELNLELEARVQERTEALNGALKELEGLTYTCSHDLRNHLRSVIANSGFLRELCPDLGPEANDILSRIDGNARQLSRLVDDLLSLTRLKREILAPDDIDLTSLVHSIVTDLTERAGRSHIRFVVDENMRIFADMRLIGQALECLLDNAVKFSPNGGTVVVGLRREQDKVTLFVRDEGIGFDVVFLPRALLPFERLHGDPRISGTGIGLAKVQWIVDAHGGQLTAVSAPGKGSTFAIALPA